MILSMIVAVDQHNGIGKDNDMPWDLPDDMKRFMKTTSKHTVLMGRKTWDSLRVQPLPNRRNIVISRQPDFEAKGAEVVSSVDEALALCQNDGEVFVIGGGTIYKAFYPHAQKLYLTRIAASFDTDTSFPAINSNDWKITYEENHPADEIHAVPFVFLTLERI